MEKEKIPAGDIKVNSSFLRWLDNYWYHNKTKTIIILFVIFVIVISVVQMCSIEREDTNLLYSGPRLMTNAEFEGVRSVFNAVMPRDYNNDGKKYTQMITYQVMSNEQLKELSDSSGSLNSGYYAKEYESYSNLLMTGETSLYLVDPWLFENLEKDGRLEKLKDVFGEVPSSAYGEYGVILGDTEIYQYYEALRILPADTLVCLIKPYLFGKSSNEETYNNSRDMFKAIINFKAPDGINSGAS